LILLDTHVLLWLVLGDKRLKAPVRRLIAGAEEVGVSAVTFWEVATLIRHGRLRAAGPAGGWRAAVLSLGIADVPIDGEIAWRAGAMDHSHGDPADRLIMATAMARSAKLITADREILRHREDLLLVDAR
jgi:PIN domain nuclease of toxin-antitoxin system